ncbi:hypothetical protein YC2023_071505 [Brassica napus]
MNILKYKRSHNTGFNRPKHVDIVFENYEDCPTSRNQSKYKLVFFACSEFRVIELEKVKNVKQTTAASAEGQILPTVSENEFGGLGGIVLTIQIYEKDIDLEEKNKEGETRGEKSYNKFTEMNEGETRNRKKIMKYRIKKLESEKE